MTAGIALFASIEPMINARLSQDPMTFAFQFAAFVLAFIITQPIVGRLSDRFGRKPFIVAGLVLVVPVLFAQGFVINSNEMTVLRILQGIGSAMAFGPALALTGDLVTRGDSGTKLSVLTMAFGLGAGVGPVIAGPLVQVTFAAPFVFCAILTALGAVLVQTQVTPTTAADDNDATTSVPTNS